MQGWFNRRKKIDASDHITKMKEKNKPRDYLKLFGKKHLTKSSTILQ
jgi:hypothetical protein